MIQINIFLQISKYCGLLITLTNLLLAQTSPLDYFPAHAGDKWQYRDAAFNDIVFRRYIDSVTTDSNNNTIVWTRTGGGTLNYQQFKIDSLFNVYNLNFQSKYVHYKLNADSGDSWIGGIGIPNTLDTTIITMIYSAYGYVYGKLVKIKVYEFVIHQSFGFILNLGRDYLAEGFGLVRMNVEPGATYRLSGAIINKTHYGEPILKVEERVLQENQFILSQNYPNPFNSRTVITYSLPSPQNVTLIIYDVLGKEIAVLVNQHQTSGSYSIGFSPSSGLSSGIYFYALKTNSSTKMKKLIYMK